MNEAPVELVDETELEESVAIADEELEEDDVIRSLGVEIEALLERMIGDADRLDALRGLRAVAQELALRLGRPTVTIEEVFEHAERDGISKAHLASLARRITG
jgi:hypothetical protein